MCVKQRLWQLLEEFTQVGRWREGKRKCRWEESVPLRPQQQDLCCLICMCYPRVERSWDSLIRWRSWERRTSPKISSRSICLTWDHNLRKTPMHMQASLHVIHTLCLHCSYNLGLWLCLGARARATTRSYSQGQSYSYELRLELLELQLGAKARATPRSYIQELQRQSYS